MAAMYARAAGPTLKSKLEELSRLSPDERHALGDEVDMARVMAERAVSMYDAAHFAEQGEGSPELRSKAHAVLRDALRFVSQLVDKAARVRAVNVGTVDWEQVDYFVDAITRILEEELADAGHQVLCDRVIERMKAIKMPERKAVNSDPAQVAQQLREAAAAIDGQIATSPGE